MYIEPVALFILAEIVVLLLIICFFLLYKSRLYKILKELVWELRQKRLHREQSNQDNVTNVTKPKDGELFAIEPVLASPNKPAASMSEQLGRYIAELIQEDSKSKENLNSVEGSRSPLWLRLRILELEKERLCGNITDDRWHELASATIQRMLESDEDADTATQESIEEVEGDGETEQPDASLSDMQNRLDAANTRADSLERELAELKTINRPSEPIIAQPTVGKHDDQIYQLKCDNFDLQESINKLKLTLHETDPTVDKDEYMSILETQISNLEQYMNSADIASGLMEKEIAAANKTINDLQEQPTLQGNAPGTDNLSSAQQSGDH